MVILLWQGLFSVCLSCRTKWYLRSDPYRTRYISLHIFCTIFSPLGGGLIMWTWKCYLLSEVMSWLISLCRWLLAKPPTLPPSLSLTHTCTYSNAHTHTHPHTQSYMRAHVSHTLPALGCQDWDEQQRCHCVVLYYTWISEPHAFLIKVICPGPACVGVCSVR